MSEDPSVDFWWRGIFCAEVNGMVLVELNGTQFSKSFRLVEARFESIRAAIREIGPAGLNDQMDMERENSELLRRIKLLGCRSWAEFQRVRKFAYVQFRLFPEVECLTDGLACGPDDFDAIAEFLWAGLLASPMTGRTVSLPKVVGDNDRGIPFGPGEVWFAVRSDDSNLVAKKFGVKRPERVSWAGLGDESLRRSGVLVTAPLDGWVLVLVTGNHEDLETAPDLLSDDPDWGGEVVKVLSRRLKTDVQLFGWNYAFPVAAWARSGKIVAVEEFPDLDVADAEGVVGKLAAAWSVDPTKLNDFEGIPSSLFGFDFDPPWN
jgi:hypothetical protein